ncbi:MAG: SAM-dependent methyltransferase, partial [Ruminococcus sp.]|nr:SAM-dependent methyltransferase [Ruminococcus sp.]
MFTDENNAFKPEILSEASRVEITATDSEGIERTYTDRNYILDLLDAQQNDTLYKYLLIAQCNALNCGLPEMFEEIGGWTELLFPNNLLRNDSVIAHMVEDIPEDNWKDQVQIIGWLYQYYNSEKKDAVFAAMSNKVKVSKENIAAATQLFTPDWIVRYMV